MQDPTIRMFDLVTCLTEAMDLVNPAVVNHHYQVAYIACQLARELNLDPHAANEIMNAALLHDVGGLALNERIEAMRFDVENPYRHAVQGALLLRSFKPLEAVSEIIRYHHIHWNKGGGKEYLGQIIPYGSHIIHLADRVAVLIDKKQEILGQVNGIVRKIRMNEGKVFMPEIVDALEQLACREYFWLDVTGSHIRDYLRRSENKAAVDLDWDDMERLGIIFSQIIDFRSSFTATHSSGVAATAVALARKTGFCDKELSMMRVAGYVHDLGKLAVPNEVLDKPGRLSEPEVNVIKSHPYIAFRILQQVHGLEDVNYWGSLHHERMDGQGYPFHIKGDKLPVGSRILAVADVFTALSEKRPYRDGLDKNQTIALMKESAAGGGLDGDIVSLCVAHFDEIDQVRRDVQCVTMEEYLNISQIDS